MEIDNCCSPGQDKHTHDHGHFEVPFLGERSELVFSLLCGFFLLSGFILEWQGGLSRAGWITLYLLSYFFGGFYAVAEAWESIRKGRFNIDSLMIIAAIGAAILGYWAEGGLLLFLFSLGHALEHMAMNKARKSISDLGKITPDTALKLIDGTVVEVGIQELSRGDIVRVKPNTAIPVDGVVIRGSGWVNQAPITGESIPVTKEAIPLVDTELPDFSDLSPDHRVFAGSLNGTTGLEICVLRKAEDTTLARLVKLVSEAESQKSTTQLFTDKFQRIFVPAVLILVALLHFAFLVVDESFQDSFYRAMAVLVASSPCALAISTPSAVLSGVARAARSGVLIKGGGPLELLGAVKTIAFDKTGTITRGEPVLVDVFPAKGVSEEEFLKILAAVEALSDHTLARAVVDGVEQRGISVPFGSATHLTAMGGKGVEAEFEGQMVWVGNKELFDQEGIRIPQPLLEKINKAVEEGKTIAITYRQDKFLGAVSLRDEPKEEVRSVLRQLQGQGIENIIMLTGDHQKVGEAISEETGLTRVYGNLLPEEKVDAIKELRKEYEHVAMVGDGVNDAPAMAHSSVSVAMGVAGSDVALETADVALMNDDLNGLPFVIALSRKSKQIIRQNLWISLGMVAILIPLTIAGVARIGPAVVAHEGSTLLVVLNALRLLRFSYRGN